MRSVPLVLVIFWFFFLVPYIGAWIIGAAAADPGRRVPLGADHLHAVRGGVLLRDHARRHPVDPARPGRGGYALGLNYWQTMGNIVLPQAFRNMLPVLLTQTIILFQDTSLVYVISVTDFLGAASKVAQRDGPPGRDVPVRRGRLLRHLVRRVLRRASAANAESPSSAESPDDRRSSNVSKWYGSFQVLTDCTTEVEKGEVVVVCGPSGRGKSTLIKMRQRARAVPEGRDHASTASRSATRRPTCRSCARASAWCSSTSSCSRT